MRGRAILLGLLVFAGVAALTMRKAAAARPASDRILLPLEVLGEDGATLAVSFSLDAPQSRAAQSLRLQIHGLRYAEEASLQINSGGWIALRNDTVSVAEPARSFGGIGGGFSTLKITVALPPDAFAAGGNTIRFRFNHTDGFVSGFRVLAFNVLDASGQRLLPPDRFAQDDPAAWTPPLSGASSIEAGKQLWRSAPLVSSSIANSPKIQAHCSDCHAHDGRDLKYFNFSNHSIITRSRFHGLSQLEGEQIASYIRSLPMSNPGRPWNPPYQPGPGLDAQPVSNWAAGAGLAWVLDRDEDAFPYLANQTGGRTGTAVPPAERADLSAITAKITPELFRPDGNLNPREIPIALQLPDWSGWLPRVHPKDVWGAAFTESEFAALYDGGSPATGAKSNRSSLRALLSAGQGASRNSQAVSAAFAQWSQARQDFLKRFLKPETRWSPQLANHVYSAQLWQLVKAWEMTQESGLESRGREFFGAAAEPRTWCNTVPQEAAPASAHIPDGPAGVGGSALTNEYFNASWYELQILLNAGNHQRRDRGPVDWVYMAGRIHDLYAQTHQPEPARLLVAVIKAQQSTDPRIGPDDLRRGWRPEDNVDPRIMVSPVWAPIFQPLPAELRRALTSAFLSAWMDKNLQYSIARYLPFGLARKPYVVPYEYGEITGGQTWSAAQQFKAAGVPPELISRLAAWGSTYNERAARLQYDQSSSRKM